MAAISDEFFRDLERRRLRALVKPDPVTARALHALDYQLITPGAATLTADEYLGGIESGAFDYVVFEPISEISVLMLGDGAAVRYRARIQVRYAGGEDAGQFWHTDIYARRDGRWQVVWSHATRMRP
jgi:hypothetical protein